MVKTKPEDLTKDEVCAIMNAASDKCRDYLILRIFAKTGIRLSELAGIERRDIKEFQEKDEKGMVKAARFLIHISEDTAKRGEEREVVIDESTSTLLKQYLSQNKKELDAHEKKVKKLNDEHKVELQTDAVSKKRASIWFNLTPMAIENLVKKYTKLAGVSKNVSPHAFRHFYCTLLVREGMPLHQIQKLMGHKNLNTTLSVYARVMTNDCLPSYDAIMGGW